ncbi:MAG: cyclic nucleotide-binding domain-containing protein [Anaerolineales bacterium]|nr:cyclic nucleotide-binding domain-containing protein [Anaerolineales bacterium]
MLYYRTSPNMQTRIDAILNIRPEERRTVYLMLAQYFFMGAAMLFAQTASMPLFLTYWDVSAIPFTYIGIAVIVSTITAIFLKISERVSLARWLWLTMVFLVLVTLGFRFGLAAAPSKALALFLPIWTQTLINLAVLAFWTLASDIFDVRQGKRLFGLLNAGSWFSYVVAGPFSGTIAKSLGTENLYIIIAACLFIALLFQSAILRGMKKPSIQNTDARTPEQPPTSALFRNRYILLVFALAALWRVAYFVMDAIFYGMTSIQFPNAADNAGFIGNFFSMVGLLGFLTDTFLTGRIISKFGLWAGLLTTPIVLIASMSGFASVGIFASSWTLGLFWFAIAGKFNNEGLGFTLDQSASSILYQPIADALRPKARAIGEGIIQPAAIGIAGLLLALLSNGLKLDTIQLSFVYIVLAIAWLVLSIILANAYPKQLVEAINKRRFKREELINIEEINSEILFKGLSSQHDGTVIYSLDLLEELNHPNLKSELINLLGHASSSVRVSVLEKIERIKPQQARKSLVEHIPQENIPNNRRAAVQAFSALSADDINLILPYLNSNNEANTFGALVGLLKYGGEDGLSISKEKLEKLAGHPLPAKRLLAAQTLRRFGSQGFESLLEKLLDDPEIKVRREALLAAGTGKQNTNWFKVINAMKNPSTRAQAAQALEMGGEASLPFIAITLTQTDFSKAALRKLIHVCGNIRGASVIAMLEPHIGHTDSDLREAVLAALAECGYRADPVNGQSQAQVKYETEHVRMLYSALREIESKDEMNLLAQAIRIEIYHARERLFHLLSFMYDRKAVTNARRVILRKDAAKIPYAIETLDTILPRDIKLIMLPLAEELSAVEACKRLGISEKVSMQELAEQSQGWLAICVHALIKNGDIKMHSTVEKVLILRSVNLFKSTPDDALAELSELLTEMEMPAGKNIVEKGEQGNSMFIIVSGKVAVMDGERVLNTLGERAVFGELALLDTEPRTATIRALEDTLVFRLDQEPFYELMSDRVEVAMGTIQMLTGNLRARVREVIDLREELGK